MKRRWRAKPLWANLRTCSSTSWMLTGARSSGRTTENISMRSTSATIRSASSQISRVSSRSPGSAPCSSSWAAPRMPDSGFLTSCASIAAMAVTERAALRWINWSSILRAIERSCSDTTTLPAGSVMVETAAETKWAPMRGVSRVMPYSETEWPLRRACSIKPSTGLSAGSTASSRRPAKAALLPWKNCSAAGLR